MKSVLLIIILFTTCFSAWYPVFDSTKTKKLKIDSVKNAVLKTDANGKVIACIKLNDTLNFDSITARALKVTGHADLNKARIDSFIDIMQTIAPALPTDLRQRIFTIADDGFTVLQFMDSTGLTFRIGQDGYRIARNTTGATVPKGRCTYFSGSTGNKPNFGLAISNTFSKMPCIGMTVASVANNSFGILQFLGKISGINTSGFTEGKPIYPSSVDSGLFVATSPVHPNFSQALGTIEVEGVGNGSILLNIGPHLKGNESGTNLNQFTIGDQLVGQKKLIFDGLTNDTIIWNDTTLYLGKSITTDTAHTRTITISKVVGGSKAKVAVIKSNGELDTVPDGTNGQGLGTDGAGNYAFTNFTVDTGGGITTINGSTELIQTISGQSPWLAVVESGTGNCVHTIGTVSGYIIPTGTNNKVDSADFLDGQHGSYYDTVGHGAKVTGSGTADYFPIWTGASTQGNSTMHVSSGNIGFGPVTPATHFHVSSGDAYTIIRIQDTAQGGYSGFSLMSKTDAVDYAQCEVKKNGNGVAGTIGGWPAKRVLYVGNDGIADSTAMIFEQAGNWPMMLMSSSLVWIKIMSTGVYLPQFSVAGFVANGADGLLSTRTAAQVLVDIGALGLHAKADSSVRADTAKQIKGLSNYLVLYGNSSGNIAQSNNLFFDGTNLQVGSLNQATQIGTYSGFAYITSGATSHLWINPAVGKSLYLSDYTGLLKATGGLISAITDNSANWNTAYGWGNHASAGYASATHGVTIDYVPYAVTSTTWGTSSIYANGTNIGVGTSVIPSETKINVNGNIGVNNEINELVTNGVGSVRINFRGYAAGNTQFRNFIVGDGKYNDIFTVIGSTGEASFHDSVSVPGNLRIGKGVNTEIINIPWSIRTYAFHPYDTCTSCTIDTLTIRSEGTSRFHITPSHSGQAIMITGGWEGDEVLVFNASVSDVLGVIDGTSIQAGRLVALFKIGGVWTSLPYQN